MVHYASIGDSRVYLLPDAGDGPDAHRRRLGGPGADRGRARRARRPRRPAGARDHQVARQGQPRRSCRGSGSVDGRPAPAGCSPAPTACGTTPPSRRRCSEQIAAAGSDGPARCRAAPGRVRERRRAGRTTSPSRWPGSAPVAGAECRTGTVATRRRGDPMAEFTATVYQNEFLPDGGTDVNAIVTVDCSGAGTAGQTGSGAAGEIIIIDTSGSMGQSAMAAAKQAAPGGAGRDRRRHLLRRDLRQRRGLPRLPARQRGPGDGADERRHPRPRPPTPISRLRSGGGTAISDLARPGRRAVHVGARGHAAARDPAHRRREQRAGTGARRGDRPGHRLLPVRLPRRRRRLAGRGDPPDRPGPARHRRHHPAARRRWRPSSRR